MMKWQDGEAGNKDARTLAYLTPVRESKLGWREL